MKPQGKHFSKVLDTQTKKHIRADSELQDYYIIISNFIFILILLFKLLTHNECYVSIYIYNYSDNDTQTYFVLNYL